MVIPQGMAGPGKEAGAEPLRLEGPAAVGSPL